MSAPTLCPPQAVCSKGTASNVSSAATKAPRGRAWLCGNTFSWAFEGDAVMPAHGELPIVAVAINVTGIPYSNSSHTYAECS